MKLTSICALISDGFKNNIICLFFSKTALRSCVPTVYDYIGVGAGKCLGVLKIFTRIFPNSFEKLFCDFATLV